jgi:hypothetical protein
VRYVFPDSPAEIAGISVGDLVTSVAGRPIENANALRQALAEFEPSAEVVLGTLRADNERAVTVKLSSMPESIPATLPEPFPAVEAVNEDLPQLGKMNIKLPEEKAECHAYIPASYDPRFQHGLIVLLPVPGKENVDEAISQWRDLCDSARTILLMPQATDRRSWLPTETTFIRKTIDNLKTTYNVDPERIVVFGSDNSGAMALLVGFTHRDLIRGIVAINAPVPRGAPSIFNEPLQRLALYVGTPEESPLSKRVDFNVRTLRESRFPVTRVNVSETDGLSATQMTELMRWIDSLDRI